MTLLIIIDGVEKELMIKDIYDYMEICFDLILLKIKFYLKEVD